MKSHAICVNNHNHTQKTISAFEAFLLREENHREYKNLTFYYKIISEEYKVFPKYNNSTQTAYFAFYSHNTNLASNEAEGESLTHYVVKRALANLSTIHLKNDYRDIDLLIKTTKSEYEKLLVLQIHFVQMFTMNSIKTNRVKKAENIFTNGMENSSLKYM